MNLKTVSEKFYFKSLRAFRSIGHADTEIVLLQAGDGDAYWTVIAAGTPSEAINQSLNVLQHTQLLSPQGEVLLGDDLLHHIKSLIENTSINTERIINYPLYPFYDKEQKSQVTAAIETFFPKDKFILRMRLGATALEIHDIRIFQKHLMTELQRINRDWFSISKEEAAEIISAALNNPDFHSELFRHTIPTVWNAR